MIDRATRKRLNARLRDTGNMQDKNSATLEVMQDMPGMDNEVFRIRNCSMRNPCNRSACQYCSGTVIRREPRHRNPVAQKKRDPEEARRKSRNYKARGGQWLGAPFQHLNEEQCYALTINFSLEELSMDGKSVGQRERKKFKRIMQHILPDAVVRLITDITPVSADTSCLDYPADSVTGRFQVIPRPSEPAILFHAHGIIWHPFWDIKKLGAVLRDAYPGCKRICLMRTLPPKIDNHGNLVGGIEGFGEYASMEKTRVDFPDQEDDDESEPEKDNVAVVKAMQAIRKNWCRAARKIGFNDRMHMTGGQDPVPSDHLPLDSSDCETVLPDSSPEAPSGPYNYIITGTGVSSHISMENPEPAESSFSSNTKKPLVRRYECPEPDV